MHNFLPYCSTVLLERELAIETDDPITYLTAASRAPRPSRS